MRISDWSSDVCSSDLNDLQLLLDDETAHIVVGEAGALAQGLRAGLDITAQGNRQQALNQAGARTTGARGLAATAHRVERMRAALDALDDSALGNAVAATDFRIGG